MFVCLYVCCPQDWPLILHIPKCSQMVGGIEQYEAIGRYLDVMKIPQLKLHGHQAGLTPIAPRPIAYGEPPKFGYYDMRNEVHGAYLIKEGTQSSLFL